MTQNLYFLTHGAKNACVCHKKALPLYRICERMDTLVVIMHSIQEIRKPIAKDFHQFESAFEKILSSENKLLNDVLVYIHSKRGKQLRPQLVLLSAAVCRGVTDKSIQTAVALELLHTSTLVHDDVVDDSPTRRGDQAVHARWNNKVAVLVGDYMLAEVIRIVSEIRNVKILNIVAGMGQALSSGELLQLHNGESMWISEEQYYSVIEQKTARLFAACMEAGAESTGATQRQTSALREFGLQLGMCFQLKDDILDYSDSEEIGKPTMNDIRDGKATLPLLISLARAPREEADSIRALAEGLAIGAAHVDVADAEQTIKAFVLRYDGVRYAYQQMQKHKKKGMEALAVFHASPAKLSLLALLDYSINRMK